MWSAGKAIGHRVPSPLLWYVVFVLPLFLFVPDASKKSKLVPAVRSGLRDLAASFRHARANRPLFVFLLANMIYKDGLVALFAFGGIYAAGQLGWGPIQIGSFGILLTVTGIIGAVIGGWLDDIYGPKVVLLGALSLLFLCGLGMISIDRDTVFFVVSVEPTTPGRFAESLPEQMFLSLGGMIGAAAGPLQSASRSMLVVLAPKQQITQYFGLLALSGKVTSFLAPFCGQFDDRLEW